MIVQINPAVVLVRDGRVGCLVARYGMKGCVEFENQRSLEIHLLVDLRYNIMRPPNYKGDKPLNYV